MVNFEYLFKNGLLNKKDFLLDNFSLLNLDAKAVMFILLVERYSEQRMSFSSKSIAEKMKVSMSEFNDIYKELSNAKKLVSINVDNGLTYANTDNVYYKLFELKSQELFNIERSQIKIDESERQKNIIHTFEESFGRKLKPMEIEIIKDWIDNFNEELILDSLKKAVMMNILNLSYIQGIITSTLEVLNG